MFTTNGVGGSVYFQYGGLPAVSDNDLLHAPGDDWGETSRWVKMVVRSCAPVSPAAFARIDEDLHQEGLAAVAQGLQDFDPSRGVPLRAYLRMRISRAVRDYLRTIDPLPRSMRAHARLIARTREQLCHKQHCDPSIHDIARHSGIPPSRVAFILRHEEAPRPLPPLDSAPLYSESDDDPALEVETTEQRLALRQALFALPEQQRRVVTWRYLHGFTVTDIAQRLDITPGAVSQLCNRGISNIRVRLREQEWIDHAEAMKVRR